MVGLHSVTFEWPYGNANNVILTGTFDHWSKSIRLDKQDSSFKGTVKVPWNQKVAYKFIVDGEWRVNDREPTERDPAGNLNNIYVAPEKPAELPKPESTVQRQPVPEKIEDTSAEKPLSSEVAVPTSLSDLAQTVVAAEGTASVVDYVASGVGAAIQKVLGVDPVNANKLPVQTPKTELSESSVIDESTKASHVDVEGQPDESVKDAGVRKSSNVNASTDTTPVLNGTATSTEVSRSNNSIQTQSILPVVSGVDNTLAPPPKEVVTAHGPSTHTPGVIADAAGSTVTDSNVKAETPAGGSEDKPTAQPPAQSSSSAQAVSSSVPAANGDSTHPINGPADASTSTPPTSRGASPSPSTPTKGKHQRFPSSILSSGSPKSDKSSGSSRFRTISHSGSIKKTLKGLRRISFKEIFGLEKSKEKEEN